MSPGENTGDVLRSLLESAILESRRSVLSLPELLRAFMDAQVVVPSAQPVISLDRLEPLLWSYDGVSYVGVFTHPDRAIAFSEAAPNLAAMAGRKVVGLINADSAGLLINPGADDYSFVIPPSAVVAMRREFGG
ncbi:SseB family protein [Mesorhizobium japonicum]|uniref:SseB family protein n=1 Tax=Mesorhizobium japonicum TaxID=2066070 RepID=UPI003B5A84AF